ncbi:DUF1015 domain-containing protein [Limisalsivibrio acetivorans]|uniref:DUF1015 domain-containing protein n=1 Tax=Limisalsivibrio acetivorans TaxID=1304888 RepID=UPI0003B3148B|nr:DUF1015 domain-containing protein [Limisalsivibrio acetivorans]
MAIVRPFMGVRYNLEKVLLKQVIAPPYDVISEKMKEELKERCGTNVVKLILPDGEEDKYKNASKLYEDWKKDDTLVKDKKQSFYLYEQVYTFAGREYVRTGFIGLLRLEELGKGSVFPHEKTLAGPKKDRLELMKACKTNFSQIFGLYMDKENRLANNFNSVKKNMPVSSAVDDEGVKNTIWQIDDHEIIESIEAFLKDKAIYIADGHHRYETALNYRNHMREQNEDIEGDIKPYDYVMMMFVNFYDEGLKIFPTHRVVELGNDFSYEEFKEKVSKSFELVEIESKEQGDKFVNEPGENRNFLVYYDNKYLGLTLRDEVLETLHPVYRKVDTFLIQETVIKECLGMTDEQILRKEGIYFLQTMDQINSVMEQKPAMALMLKGVDIDVVREISESGLVMPQKSTYFYPKLQTGLVINEL